MLTLSLTDLQHYKDPLPANSSVIINWTCKEGRAWSFGNNKLVAACKHNYIDIREVVDGKTTIKGITLTLQEWQDFISTISSVANYLTKDVLV